tara:strand:- start:311 stop:541 length:231 start_codon:yes stop_codon:yes gene_type:complete
MEWLRQIVCFEGEGGRPRNQAKFRHVEGFIHPLFRIASDGEDFFVEQFAEFPRGNCGEQKFLVAGGFRDQSLDFGR